MDVGAEYGNYSSDMTRTVPVSGKFTKRQKEIYNAVLRVKNEATKLLTVGNNWKIFHEQVGEIMTKELLDVRLIDNCLLYTSPSPRDMRRSRMPSSA